MQGEGRVGVRWQNREERTTRRQKPPHACRGSVRRKSLPLRAGGGQGGGATSKPSKRKGGDAMTSRKGRNYAKENLARIRQLRHDVPKSEKKLWYDGLSGQRLDFRFRRQYPIGPYSLDFYCPEIKLCVEIDGSSHDERLERDLNRDAYLAEQGIATLRIPVSSVVGSFEDVLSLIETTCRERAGRTPTLPSPCKQGEAVR